MPDDAQQAANIIVEALRNKGYDAGIATTGFSPQWLHYDIKVMWYNLVIGSKKRNRSWLQVTWNKKEMTLAIFGHRYTSPPQMKARDLVEAHTFNLAEPDSLDKIVDLIEKTALEDKYSYPWI
jgi:hypothetical protein